MFLCPRKVLTCIMSLVLWYSIVPLKCLNVCMCMAFSRGLLSFLAVLFRRASNVIRIACLLVWNTFSVSCGIWFSMATSFSLIGSIRLLLPFSAVM